MTAPTQLTSPLVDVTRASDPEPVRLQTLNPDLVLWDRTRVKHKWPKFDEAPFLWLTFLTWAAARRTGLIDPSVTYEAWEADVTQVDTVDTDPDDETGRPTLPALEAG